MRKTAALLVAFGMLAALTACSGTASAQGCDSPITSGGASSVVTAAGELGSQPKVEFPTPVVTQKTQRTQLLPGDGPALQTGEPALVELTLLNGATGAVLTQTAYDGIGGSLITVGPSSFPSLSRGLKCATVGSRVAIVGSAKDTHNGQASEGQGIGADDSFVFVVDILKAFPAKADGNGQVPEVGLPAVVLAPNGAPGITVPHSSAPNELKVALLQTGDGTKVADSDYVVLKYTAIAWADGAVVDSTWKDGPAVVKEMVKSDTVPEGLVKGLVGKRTGSQVLLVIPPKLAQGVTSAPTDATLVYVVDILGIIPHSK
ncbi:MAG: FKBP-type peptidyl-prolyl cis-trans isomerase [Terrimesophilobacter sp.]